MTLEVALMGGSQQDGRLGEGPRLRAGHFAVAARAGVMPEI